MAKKSGSGRVLEHDALSRTGLDVVAAILQSRLRIGSIMSTRPHRVLGLYWLSCISTFKKINSFDDVFKCSIDFVEVL